MPSPELFPEDGSTPGSDKHFADGSLALASLDLAVLDLRPKFDCNAHYHGFWPQQLAAAWDQPM